MRTLTDMMNFLVLRSVFFIFNDLKIFFYVVIQNLLTITFYKLNAIIWFQKKSWLFPYLVDTYIIFISTVCFLKILY